MEKKTLHEQFESNKQNLQQALEGLILPQDYEKVQKVVTSYLESVFDSEGEFRQNLTQSEDYILEAAISLLNAQQKMNTVLTQKSEAPTIHKDNSSLDEREPKDGRSWLSTNSTYAMLGATGGALAGKLILGGWGAVFGSIAGVAISVYLSYHETLSLSNSKTPIVEEEELNIPIDVDCFIGIVHDVCESVDNLIGTFRAQVNRVVQKYESQEKPSLNREYRILLESIQSLVGYERNHDISEEKYNKKIQERIENLADSLDNYDITLENYSDEKASWFDKVASQHATELKEVLPAIVKNGTLIIPGKVFIPA